ncbi:MAG: hypothetical protein WAK55_29715 [Xanthobacteraceae bacterium]
MLHQHLPVIPVVVVIPVAVVVIPVAVCSTQRQQWAALAVARFNAAVAITVLQVAAQKTAAEFTIAKSGTTAIFGF